LRTKSSTASPRRSGGGVAGNPVYASLAVSMRSLSHAENRPSTERVFCSNELAVCGSSAVFNACAG
jgi:hypothetical protein